MAPLKNRYKIQTRMFKTPQPTIIHFFSIHHCLIVSVCTNGWWDGVRVDLHRYDIKLIPQKQQIIQKTGGTSNKMFPYSTVHYDKAF